MFFTLPYHLKVFWGETMKGLKERKNKRSGGKKKEGKKEEKGRREKEREGERKEGRNPELQQNRALRQCQYKGDYVPHK